MNGYHISTNPDLLNSDLIHHYLSEKSYWARGMSKEKLLVALKHSLCFGVYDCEGQLVAFGRTITDKATFAYLSDVFVVEEYQGQGLGGWLIEIIVNHPDLQGLRRMMLATKDAHSLYEKFGFELIKDETMLMQIV
ncbi:GNAT family N-acetyltransferase [Vibrio sp. WXL210]|uniref:GNAT family N-acetyltransferase n=1 Tax=Vibrio sp. WXL210 TaxID=3450709 RepID=UPI003EC4FC3D